MKTIILAAVLYVSWTLVAASEARPKRNFRIKLRKRHGIARRDVSHLLGNQGDAPHLSHHHYDGMEIPILGSDALQNSGKYAPSEWFELDYKPTAVSNLPMAEHGNVVHPSRQYLPLPVPKPTVTIPSNNPKPTPQNYYLPPPSNNYLPVPNPTPQKPTAQIPSVNYLPSVEMVPPHKTPSRNYLPIPSIPIQDLSKNYLPPVETVPPKNTETNAVHNSYKPQQVNQMNHNQEHWQQHNTNSYKPQQHNYQLNQMDHNQDTSQEQWQQHNHHSNKLKYQWRDPNPREHGFTQQINVDENSNQLQSEEWQLHNVNTHANRGFIPKNNAHFIRNPWQPLTQGHDQVKCDKPHQLEDPFKYGQGVDSHNNLKNGENLLEGDDSRNTLSPKDNHLEDTNHLAQTNVQQQNSYQWYQDDHSSSNTLKGDDSHNTLSPKQNHLEDANHLPQPNVWQQNSYQWYQDDPSSSNTLKDDDSHNTLSPKQNHLEDANHLPQTNVHQRNPNFEVFGTRGHTKTAEGRYMRSNRLNEGVHDSSNDGYNYPKPHELTEGNDFSKIRPPGIERHNSSREESDSVISVSQNNHRWKQEKKPQRHSKNEWKDRVNKPADKWNAKPKDDGNQHQLQLHQLQLSDKVKDIAAIVWNQQGIQQQYNPHGSGNTNKSKVLLQDLKDTLWQESANEPQTDKHQWRDANKSKNTHWQESHEINDSKDNDKPSHESTAAEENLWKESQVHWQQSAVVEDPKLLSQQYNSHYFGKSGKSKGLGVTQTSQGNHWRQHEPSSSHQPHAEAAEYDQQSSHTKKGPISHRLPHSDFETEDYGIHFSYGSDKGNTKVWLDPTHGQGHHGEHKNHEHRDHKNDRNQHHHKNKGPSDDKHNKYKGNQGNHHDHYSVEHQKNKDTHNHNGHTQHHYVEHQENKDASQDVHNEHTQHHSVEHRGNTGASQDAHNHNEHQGNHHGSNSGHQETNRPSHDVQHQHHNQGSNVPSQDEHKHKRPSHDERKRQHHNPSEHQGNNMSSQVEHKHKMNDEHNHSDHDEINYYHNQDHHHHHLEHHGNNKPLNDDEHHHSGHDQHHHHHLEHQGNNNQLNDDKHHHSGHDQHHQKRSKNEGLSHGKPNHEKDADVEEDFHGKPRPQIYHDNDKRPANSDDLKDHSERDKTGKQKLTKGSRNKWNKQQGGGDDDDNTDEKRVDGHQQNMNGNSHTDPEPYYY